MSLIQKLYKENYAVINSKYPDAHALSHYGGGSGPIHFAGIFCNGNETQLADCPVLRTGDTDRPNVCGSHYNVAGVRCPSGELLLYSNT